MNPIVGVIVYKLIMGVLIGLVITGIVLLVKYATHTKASSPYVFEQFAPQGDAPQGDAPQGGAQQGVKPQGKPNDAKEELIKKLRKAIDQFQKDLLEIRVCARETCNVNKVLEDLFAKKMATLDKDLSDVPAELKKKWEKYRATGAEKAFKLYMKDYSWTHNRVQLLECFASDELQALVSQIQMAGQSNELKEAVGLFIIIKNTLKFNELFLSEYKQASDSIKTAVSSFSTMEGFANVKGPQLKEIAQSQLEKLGQFHDAVTTAKKEVDAQKATLIDVVKTFSEFAP
jgi:hypothetical protein